MVFGKEVADWIERSHDETNHTDDNLSIWDFVVSDISQILRNIMSHLWGT
jgi:hypothetical protein